MLGGLTGEGIAQYLHMASVQQLATVILLVADFPRTAPIYIFHPMCASHMLLLQWD